MCTTVHICACIFFCGQGFPWAGSSQVILAAFVVSEQVRPIWSPLGLAPKQSSGNEGEGQAQHRQGYHLVQACLGGEELLVGVGGRAGCSVTMDPGGYGKSGRRPAFRSGG